MPEGSFGTGPVPKKDAERRRRNKTPDNGGISALPAEVINLDDTIHGEVEIPAADPDWEPLTLSYWDSFAGSGQSMFYEPTDWMTAYMLMETLDRWLKPQDIRVGESKPPEGMGGDVWYHFEAKRVPVPGNVLSSILKGLTSLMATEGDRRRLRLELERKTAIDAAVSGSATVTDIVSRRADAFKGA
jgi:hypothetical protein